MIKILPIKSNIEGSYLKFIFYRKITSLFKSIYKFLDKQ
ncbi:hypothetical protein EU94_1632 [Prochlorococcus marinus str. MIT 9123]|nr:hypothetical protein EU94_1632 [Prochlorococcus marinus str. MIT 9123]